MNVDTSTQQADLSSRSEGPGASNELGAALLAEIKGLREDVADLCAMFRIAVESGAGA